VIAVMAVAFAAPGMWLWGLNYLRFIPAGAVAIGAALMAAPFLPAIGRRLGGLLAVIGDLSMKRPWVARAAWSLVGAAVVWCLPDRTHFTGDFLLRERAITDSLAPAQFFSQAFPLDVWLHHTAPQALVGMKLASANGASRAIGMVDAAALGVLAVELCRVLALRGAAACCASAAVVLVPGLGTMTGLAKAGGELVVVGTAVAVFGLRVWRRGSGFWLAALAAAVGLSLHRSAVLLLPVLLGPLVVRRGRGAAAIGRRDLMSGLAIVLGALVWTGRRTVTTALGFDASIGYLSGPFNPAEFGRNLLDAANLLLLLAPAGLLAAFWPGRSGVPRRLWLLFLLPFAGLVLLMRHSPQGLFRDWDMAAGLVAPLGVLAAARLGRLLECRGPGDLRSAAIVLAVTAVPAVLWLGSQSDPRGGLYRAERFAVDPPLRPDDVRGRVWGFLCGRFVEFQDYRSAVRTGREAVRLGPTRVVLTALAGSEVAIGETAPALSHYHMLAAADSTDAVAWYNIAVLSARLGDFGGAEQALAVLETLPDGLPVVPYTTWRVERERQNGSRDSTARAIAPR
jgi:hypothetical protein